MSKAKKPARATRREEEQAPASVPHALTDEQRAHVRAALQNLRRQRRTTYAALVQDIGYPVGFLRAFARGEARGQRHFAASLARALGVDLDDLLSGKAS
jgi:ribosome-binding protein aMBF1 (putative translation factor)